jgi:hypothetical protein
MLFEKANERPAVYAAQRQLFERRKLHGGARVSHGPAQL